MNLPFQLLVVVFLAAQTAFVGLIWANGLPVRDDRSSLQQTLDEHDRLMNGVSR